MSEQPTASNAGGEDNPSLVELAESLDGQGMIGFHSFIC